MPTAQMPLAERIARVLAGADLSANAEGSEPSAARQVDEAWPDHMNQALAILHSLREPDQQMAQAGDGATWTRMVDAAISHQEGNSRRLVPEPRPSREGG